jgi:DNA polymerase eta
MKILARTTPVERASIDECYVDLSQPARALLASGGFGPELVRRVRTETKLAGLEGEGARRPPPADGADDGNGAAPAAAAAAAPAVLSREEVRRGHISQGQQQQQSALPSPADAWWDRPPALWAPGERLLLCAAAVLQNMRGAVLRELGFTCSGGIAPSKLLAKLVGAELDWAGLGLYVHVLFPNIPITHYGTPPHPPTQKQASGMNKPAQQTLVMPAMIPQLLGPLPIGRIKGLGGDFGDRVARDLQATTIGEVVQAPQRRLEQLYGESTAEWLWHLVRGVDGEKVEDRANAKSIGCGKTFYGRNNLRSLEQVHRWLAQLAGELTERLASDAELNERVPQLLTVSFQAVGVAKPDQQQQQQPQQQQPQGPVRPNQPFPGNQNFSRSAPLAVSVEQLQDNPQAVQTLLADLALGLVQKWQRQREEAHPMGQGPLPPLRLATLFLTAGKFLEITQKSKITSFFNHAGSNSSSAAVAAEAAATAAATADSGATAGPAGAGAAAAARSSSLPSPFKIKLPSSSAPASAASSSPAAAAPTGRGGGGKRKAASGGGGLEEFLIRKKEQQQQQQQQQQEQGSLPAPEEVDPDVLAALPPHIREEVLAAMNQRQQKQQQQQQQQQQRQRSAGGANGKEKKGQLDSYFARAAAAGEQKQPSSLPPSASKPAAKPAAKPLDRFLVKKKQG